MSLSTSLVREQHPRASRDPLGVCTRSGSCSAGTPTDLNQHHKTGFITDVAVETFSYLKPYELALITSTCRYWKKTINSELTWQFQCTVHNIPKRIISACVPYVPYQKIIKDLYSNIFANMFDERFYRRYNIDPGPIVPIPQNFIEAAYCLDPLGRPGELVKDNFQLMYRPEFVTIELDENLSLAIDKQGNLIEQAPSASSKDECKKDGRKKFLKVGFTINNIGKIAAKYLKNGNTGFSEGSLPNILQQHGDKLSPSGWSYQRKSVVGWGLSYSSQQALAANAGLEVVSLIDRILLNLFTQMRSGIGLDTTNVARTSTVTLNDSTIQRQSSVRWMASYGLCLLGADFDYGSGAAVGVPAQSSKA